MSDPAYSEQELQSGLKIIHNSKSYFAIISAFNMIEQSIHLSRLAKLIGKTKSTTLAHLDKLIEQAPSFIEIDTERTLNVRGSKKFYRLSQFGKQALEFQSILLQQRLEQSSVSLGSIETADFTELVKTQMVELFETFGARGLRNYFSLGAELNQNIESIASNQYTDLAERVYKAHKKGKNIAEIETPKIAAGIFLSSSMQIRVNSIEHAERIKHESLEFLRRLETLQEEFDQEISDQNGDDDTGMQHIYIGLAPIFRES